MKPIKSNEATQEDVDAQLPEFVRNAVRGNLAPKEDEHGLPDGETFTASEEDALPEDGVSESAPSPAAALKAQPKPGTYTAKGDPYTYRVDADGGVTIMEGPSGTGQKLTKGAAFNAIVGQIQSGQLTKGADGSPGLSPDRPGMNSHLDASLDELGGDDLSSTTASVVKQNMKDRG